MAFILTRQRLDEMALEAYAASSNFRGPELYPSVSDIDCLIFGESWQDDFLSGNEIPPFKSDPQERKRTMQFLVLCIMRGFKTDDAWHTENPEHKEPTAENLFLYLTKPLEGEMAGLPHCGIWRKPDPEERKEDIQAAFDYAQECLIDALKEEGILAE